MGSHNASREEEAVSSNDWTINVLVTGFGIFGNNSQNPSYSIARRLPTKHHIPGLPPIRIHTHPDPITVSYRAVRDLIPTLLFPESSSSSYNNDDNNDNKEKKTNRLPTTTTTTTTPTKPKYDIILHIGMDSGSKVYTMETCARRDGYIATDVLGESFAHDTFWKNKYGSPSTLFTSFPSDDLLARWKSKLANENKNNNNNNIILPPLHRSTDAGNYLCEFIFYTSLVEYWRRDPSVGTKRPVMFLHVPGIGSEEAVEMGRAVALALIGALVETFVVGEINGTN